MLLPRTASLALRSRATRGRVFCAGCLARQRATFATTPSQQSQPSQQAPESPSLDKASPTASTIPPPQPTKRRKRQPPRPPQPAPPDPPWPAPSARDAPVDRRKVYTTQKGLVNDVVMTAKIAEPRKFFPYASPPSSSSSITAPLLSIGVPQPPDFCNDYTNMGPDVVAPWRKGGVFRKVPERDLKALLGGGHDKDYGLRFRFSYAHTIHPWSAKYLAASPGVEDVNGSGVGGSGDGGGGGGGGGWPMGFPHCFAEVTRRKYAHKNRTNPFWWFVIVFPDESGDLPTSNLVRYKMRFKVHHAVLAALRQRGYGMEGLRLEGPAGAAAKHHQMYGSLRVEGPLRPLLDAPFDSLVAYLTKVLGVVEGLLGGREAGQPYEQNERALHENAKKKSTPNRKWSVAKKGKPRQGEGQSPDRAKDPFAMLLDPSLF